MDVVMPNVWLWTVDPSNYSYPEACRIIDDTYSYSSGIIC